MIKKYHILMSVLCLLFMCTYSPKTVEAYETQGLWTYVVNSDGTVTITDYSGLESDIIIPSKLGGKTVTKVGDTTYGAPFFNNDSVVNVTLHSNIREIGGGAFRECDNLKTVKGGTGLVTIGPSAFYVCKNLETISWGNKVKTIGNYAFYDCLKLKDVNLPYGLSTIGTASFMGCNSLINVSVPANAEVGNQAFYECKNIVNVVIGGNVQLGDDAFHYCKNIKTLKFDNGTEVISKDCFNYCESLKSITWPSTLKKIEMGAFENCSSLEKIHFPASMRDVGMNAFEGCTSVKSIILNKGLLKIQSRAFSANTQITEVTIPDTVTLVDTGAFYNCYKLTSIIIPNSVTEFSDDYTKDLDWDYTLHSATIKCYKGSFAYNQAIAEKAKYSLLTATPSTAVAFTKTKDSIVVGETYKLATTVTPSNSTDAITWTSGNVSVAQVNQYGEITGIGKGTTSIKATTTSGKSATITITVNAAPTEIKFSAASRAGVVSKTFTAKATVKDSKGTRSDVRVTYISSDTSIATVSSAGLVTPKKAGTVTIFAKVGKLITSYKLTVYNTMSIANSNIAKKLNVSSCVYNGQARKPSVIATLNGTKLVNGTDFTVTYKNNTYPGTASVVVAGKGKFTGSTTLKLTIKAPSFAPKQNTSAYATNSVSLKWSKLTGVTGYEVYRSASKSSGYKKVGTTTGVSYKNTGLSSGKTYYYKVKAYKTVSGSKKYIVTSAAITTGTRPATPVAKVTAGTKKATVTWKAVTGASGYEVYMSTSKNGTYSKVKAVSSSTKTLTKTGLTKGKRYYFKVKAYKTINGVKVFSSASTVVSVVAK